MSASTGCSRARRRPSASRLSFTLRPKMMLFGREVDGLDARAGDAHHFAGLDFADVLRVEQIERAGFRSNQPGLAASWQSKPAEHKRAEAARVAHGNKFVLR